MSLKNIFEKFRGKDQVYKDLEVQDKAMTKLNQRKMSHNEVLYNKIMAQKKEQQMKSFVEKHIKQEDKNYWHDNTILNQNNFLNKQKNMFSGSNAVSW